MFGGGGLGFFEEGIGGRSMISVTGTVVNIGSDADRVLPRGPLTLVVCVGSIVIGWSPGVAGGDCVEPLDLVGRKGFAVPKAIGGS